MDVRLDVRFHSVKKVLISTDTQDSTRVVDAKSIFSYTKEPHPSTMENSGMVGTTTCKPIIADRAANKNSRAPWLFLSRFSRKNPRKDASQQYLRVIERLQIKSLLQTRYNISPQKSKY